MRSSSFARALLVGLLVASSLNMPMAAATSVSLAHPGGGIAFTFDSGYASGTTASSILEAHGMRGTFYVVSSQLRQGPYYSAYLSASDLVNLSAKGHEIASETVTQPDLTTLGASQLTTELADSRSTLQSITGKPVTDLAYPYGAVNDVVANATASYYASGRTISWFVTDFTPTMDAYHLPAFIMRSSTSLDEAKYIVDYAQAHGVFVVLTFGRIVPTPGTYDWTPTNLDALASYVQSKGMTTTTVAQIAGAGPTPPPPSTLPPPPPTTGSGPAIVFTFDDGQQDQIAAGKTLADRGLRGTFYIVTDCNHSPVAGGCMRTSDVQALATAGHDIESHTVTHPDLVTVGVPLS